MLREENDKKEIDIKNYAKVEKVSQETSSIIWKITTHVLVVQYSMSICNPRFQVVL